MGAISISYRNLVFAEVIGTLDELGSDSRLAGGVSCIGYDLKLGFRKSTVQIPSTASRANHVIAALNDGGGYIFEL